jgi:hypothetical protein
MMRRESVRRLRVSGEGGEVGDVYFFENFETEVEKLFYFEKPLRFKEVHCLLVVDVQLF